jgi:hypothetical protein
MATFLYPLPMIHARFACETGNKIEFSITSILRRTLASMNRPEATKIPIITAL